MTIQPQATTLTFPVEFRFVSRMKDGRVIASDLGVSYNPESWPVAVDGLAAEVARRVGDRRCLVTLREIDPEDGAKEEHVVLQGLGTRWIRLPPGIVSDALNQEMSKSELVFLRSGLLGSLREFYLTERHEKSFLDKHGRKVVFKNDPLRGFTIEIYGNGPSIEPKVDPSGGGEFEFDLVVDEPAPLHVSRSITKIAYLALCVAMPGLGLSPLLDDARRFIGNGRSEDFRPYAERFVAGAWPGFHLHLYVEGHEVDAGSSEPHRLLVGLRIHHVLYIFSLAGAPTPPPDDETATYYAEVKPPERRTRTIAWRFAGATRRS